MVDQSTPTDARTREIEVDEPGLSPSTNRRLTEEVREVLGTDRVAAAGAPTTPSSRRRLQHRLPLPWQSMGFLLVQVGAGLTVGGTVLALITDDWWLLPAVVLVLGGMTYAVVAVVLAMTSNEERPSPSTVAALEEEGVVDPEGLFSALVADFDERRVIVHDARQRRCPSVGS